MLRHFPANRAAPYGFTGHCIGGVKAGLLVYVSRPVPSGGFGVKHLTVSRRVNCEVVVGTANNGLASANADMLEVAKVFKWAHWAVASMRCANHASARKPVQCRQCTLEDVIRQSPVQILMTIGYEVSIWHRVDLITVGARNTCVIIDAYKCVMTF